MVSSQMQFTHSTPSVHVCQCVKVPVVVLAFTLDTLFEDDTQVVIEMTYEPRGGVVLPEKLGRGVRPASQNPYPIHDQNLQYSLPYL